jgi:hypothetical protein
MAIAGMVNHRDVTPATAEELTMADKVAPVLLAGLTALTGWLHGTAPTTTPGWVSGVLLTGMGAAAIACAVSTVGAVRRVR